MIKKIAIAAAIASLPLAAFAEGSPWSPLEGSGQVSLGLVSQAGADFWVAKQKMTLPTKIKLDTASVGVQYGITDELSVDGTLNYSRSRFAAPAGFPIPHGEESALSDSSVGVKWRVLDEFERAGLPTVAVRLAAIVKGGYDTGKIDAIGDGASGAEASILVGKYLSSAFSLSGELGYRHRSGVPADAFGAINANYTFNATVSASVGYSAVRSRGWLDIGAPGFSPARFPEVREDRDLVRVGLGLNLAPRTSLGLNYGEVINGRNTTKAKLWGAALSQAF